MAEGQNDNTPKFTPQWTCKYRKPRNPLEAQRLYNHIRTIAYLLDASSQWFIPTFPVLASLPKEMHFGLDAVVGALLPATGDLLGLLLGLYQVALSMFFGLSPGTILMMFAYLFADAIIGVVPFIGDILDVAFKANISNLNLLEGEVKNSRWAPIVIIPSPNEWLPRPRRSSSLSSRWKQWFS